MNTKRILYIAFFAFLGAMTYFLVNHAWEGSWVTKKQFTETLAGSAQVFPIPIDPEAEFPHSIDLQMKGQVNGQALVGFGWTDSTAYVMDTVGNDFEIEHQTDWYNDTCYIFYRSLGSTAGELTVDCKIYSSKK
ncbi:MAG: hypothetical protein AAF694_27850 [Bacteroidota bacterium]